MRQAFGWLSILLLWGLGWHPGPALAGEPNQAGLVVQFDEEQIETRCLTFEGDEIRGDELLSRSGLEVLLDTSSNMGVTVCKIEGQGCVPPGEHCFCQCMGGSPCSYWNYFYRVPGAEAWTYSALGAAVRKVKPGSVEAWVWGDGSTPPSNDLTLASICGLPTSTPTAAASVPPPSPPTPITPEATLEPAQTPTHTPEPAASPKASSTAAPTPAPTPTAEPPRTLTTYLSFGLMVLLLALIGAFVWFRRS